MGLFGDDKKRDPKEQIREMQSRLRKEGYKLDRDIGAIQRTMKGQEAEIKKYGKAGNIAAARIIAKEIVNARKAVSRLYCAKAEMNSVSMHMNHQASMVRMSGNLQRSTEVMKSMSQLVKIPEIQATMRDLSKEMMKAGMMEEMMDDAMESALGSDEPEMEEAAQTELDKVLWELTEGQLGKAPDAVRDSLPAGTTSSKVPATRTPVAASAGPSSSRGAAGEEEDGLDDMAMRLQALRS